MKIIDKIATELSNDDEEVEIVKYGLTQLFILVIGLVAAAITGFLLKIPLETLFFLLLLFPLRQNAGGYHASGRITCFLLSALIFVGTIVLIKFFTIGIIGNAIIFLLGSVMLLPFAPVGNKNKPLDEKEKEVYGQRTIIIWCAQSVLFVILESQRVSPWTTIVALTVFICGTLVAVGKIHEYILGMNK